MRGENPENEKASAFCGGLGTVTSARYLVARATVAPAEREARKRKIERAGDVTCGHGYTN